MTVLTKKTTPRRFQKTPLRVTIPKDEKALAFEELGRLLGCKKSDGVTMLTRVRELILIKKQASPHRHQVPDDLRDDGLTVAVHNDYKLNGVKYTFWLFVSPDGRAFKGEGLSDAEALNQVRILWNQHKLAES